MLEPLYKTAHYGTVSDINRLKGGPQDVANQKCIDYIEKWPYMVIFLYKLYIFYTIRLFS